MDLHSPAKAYRVLQSAEKGTTYEPLKEDECKLLVKKLFPDKQAIG